MLAGSVLVLIAAFFDWRSAFLFVACLTRRASSPASPDDVDSQCERRHIGGHQNRDLRQFSANADVAI
jgi:hypothetical protein